jgi:hypothetical protein
MVSGNALHAACYHGREVTIRVLLNGGADINAEGGYFGLPYKQHQLEDME